MFTRFKKSNIIPRQTTPAVETWQAHAYGQYTEQPGRFQVHHVFTTSQTVSLTELS